MGTVWFTILFILCITCFRSLSFGTEDIENLQELNIEYFEQQLVAAGAHKMPISCANISSECMK
jgi:protoheme ferro-lyase